MQYFVVVLKCHRHVKSVIMKLLLCKKDFYILSDTTHDNDDVQNWLMERTYCAKRKVIEFPPLVEYNSSALFLVKCLSVSRYAMKKIYKILRAEFSLYVFYGLKNKMQSWSESNDIKKFSSV